VSIDTQIEFNKLTGLGYRTPNGSTLKKVSAFFVDEIGWCGVTSPSVIGCSQIGGPNLVVESSATAADALKYGPFGPTNVFAHELGHTLGLSHVAEWDSGNLMAPYEQGTSLGYLNESQISSILSNVAKTIQIDSDNNKFIEIQPYAVVASAAAVPEPATWTMLALGFGAIGFNIRKKKSNRSSLEVLS
jgi:hypothetical protein